MELAYNQYSCHHCGTVRTYNPAKRTDTPTHCRDCRTLTRVARHNDIAVTLPISGYQNWMDQALCSQIDNEVFFPEKGGSTREAKSICRTCPVMQECREYALANGERHGIWGGMSEPERRKAKRQEQAA